MMFLKNKLTTIASKRIKKFTFLINTIDVCLYLAFICTIISIGLFFTKVIVGHSGVAIVYFKSFPILFCHMAWDIVKYS